MQESNQHLSRAQQIGLMQIESFMELRLLYLQDQICSSIDLFDLA